MTQLSDFQNGRGALATLMLSYFGGASLAGKIDVTQLLSTAIAGLISVGGWVLVAWLKHKWERRRKSDEGE